MRVRRTDNFDLEKKKGQIFSFSFSFLFWLSFSMGECVQPPPIQPTDNQLSLADIDTIKVIGKGSGGIVQLVRHKWTSQFFALKVNVHNLVPALFNLLFDIYIANKHRIKCEREVYT